MTNETRCSGLSRVMHCSGFVSLKELFLEEAGEPAKEGTAAGELLSHMIRQRTDKPQVGAVATNGVTFDQDMWMYMTEIYHDLLKDAQGAVIETEERIDWPTQSGIMIRGQFDASFVVGDTLFAPDLKYGWGIVEAFENWQLLGYAIGVIFRRQALGLYLPQKIRMSIYQPRPYHEEGKHRVWEISLEQLFTQYHAAIEQKMMSIVNGDRTLQTNPYCKYCPGSGTCPAFTRAANNAIDVTLSEWSEHTMPNEELAKQLDLMTRVAEIATLRLTSLKQLAISRLQNSQTVPGWGYEPKYGDRKWRADITAGSVKILTGVDINKKEMMSPNQAEKAGLSKQFVKQFTERPNKGMELVKKDILKEANKVLTQPILGVGK